MPDANHFITAPDVLHEDWPYCHLEHLSNAELVGAKELFLVRATFPPGALHSFHRHPRREEIIYLLEGQAEQWVGREKRVLGPGDLAHIPMNEPHATFNSGSTPLKFLAILSPVDAPGPFTVDVFNELPWSGLLPPTHAGK
jgi:quercetin dioxygenase-like cupin family protein